jgi:hypothetical protein
LSPHSQANTVIGPIIRTLSGCMCAALHTLQVNRKTIFLVVLACMAVHRVCNGLHCCVVPAAQLEDDEPAVVRPAAIVHVWHVCSCESQATQIGSIEVVSTVARRGLLMPDTEAVLMDQEAAGTKTAPDVRRAQPHRSALIGRLRTFFRNTGLVWPPKPDCFRSYRLLPAISKGR